jgi:hypothetical protein
MFQKKEGEKPLDSSTNQTGEWYSGFLHDVPALVAVIRQEHSTTCGIS